MKATNTLLAASVVSALAVAGSADAATVATFNITNTGIFISPIIGTVNETGTAVLDDGGGSGIAAMTIDKVGTSNNSSSGSETFSSQVIWYGTISGSIFHVTSGTTQNIACLASSDIDGVDTGPTGCGSWRQWGVVQLLGPSVAGTVTGTTGQPGGLPLTDLNIPAGGRLVSVARGLAVIRTSMAFTPTVPVPAAAWLFGSGLLGLAGVARRRRAAN